MTTNFNVTPYYDDFSEDKNFHRVLFRPGYAVQARELTQLQTILQNQISRIGNHLFKDGAQIIPGEVTYNSGYEYVKLSVFSTSSVSDLIGTVFTGDSSGVVAEVVNAISATSTTAATIYVIYKKQGTDNSTRRFTDGETLTGDGSETATVGVSGSVLPITSNATGVGTSVNVQAGIYYINGFLVQNSDQTIILDAYSESPSSTNYRIGFAVTESFITPSDDTSLNDNATGTSNVNAPGAHRYKIELTLTKKELTDIDDTNFVELLKVKDGIIQSKVTKTDYNIIEDTLARRTYDESGDYVVENFDIDVREHYFESGSSKYDRGIYRGVVNSGITYYEDIFTAEESKALLAVAMSKGKAYVRGYEIDTQGTNYVTIDKPRDFDNINNSTTTAQIGNYIKVTNIYGTPDIGFVSGETNAFKKVRLYKSATASRGTANVGSGANQNLIGVANARFFEYDSGTVGASGSNTTSIYKLGLFNIASFTHVATTGSITLAVGETLTGGTSGATGIIETDSDTAGLYILSNVKGTFVAGESLSDETGNTSTVASNGVTTYDLSNTKQVAINTNIADDSTTVTFTADTVLTSDSTDAYDESQVTLTGTITVANSSTSVIGKGTRFTSELLVGDVIAFTDDTGEELTGTVSSITNDTTLTLSSAVGSADVTTSSPFERRRVKLYNSNENSLIYKLPVDTVKTLKTTLNNNTTDSTLTVRRQYILTLSGSGTGSITANENETFSSYSDIDWTVSLVTSGSGGASSYAVAGNIVDSDGNITIGTSGSLSQASFDYGADYGGAKIKIIATVTRNVAREKSKTLVQNHTRDINTQIDCQESRISLDRADIYKINAIYMSADFSTPATTSDENVTDRYTLDNGQRDSFYDIGSAVLKPGQTLPTGRLKVDFDYFEHGAGDYFSVDSYTGAVNYEDIPSFNSPLKGKLELRDCVDFRPRVGNFDTPGNRGTSTTVSAFFDNTQTAGPTGGASPVDLIKPGTNFRCDLEYYLSRIDAIYIDRYGFFKQSRGGPAIDPQRPEKLDDAMLLYYLKLPAYTFNTADITITPIDNRRFTMRDIGNLEQRIENLEYYTQLSLLEQTALNTQVQDADGLDRFKNGFVVDSFKGHNVGDTTSLDYNCAMDLQEGVVRPICSTRQVKLVEVNTTDAQRTTDGYQKTGDLITLPYTEEVLVENTSATKSVNVNPFAVATYIGDIKLSPDIDEWKDTNTRPDLIVQNESLYNSIKDIPNPKLTTGSFWNEWQYNWTGTFKETTTSGNTTTTTIGKTGTQTRTGIKKTLGSKTIKQSLGEKIVDVAYATYIRSNTITFTATGMKPNTRVYPFFEEVDVSAYCTPNGGSLGGNLVTDANGSVTGTFAIPSPSVSGNPKWRTGDRRFRLTSESDNFNGNGSVDTFATATYTAKGLIATQEETIYSTRVPAIKQTDLFETSSVKKVTSRTSTTTRQGNSRSNSNSKDNNQQSGGPSLVYRNGNLIQRKVTRAGKSYQTSVGPPGRNYRF